MFPNGLARFLIQLDDFANTRVIIPFHRTVNQLQENVLSIQDWGRGHAKLNIKFAKTIAYVEFPNLVPIEIEACEHASRVKDPYVLSVR